MCNKKNITRGNLCATAPVFYTSAHYITGTCDAVLLALLLLLKSYTMKTRHCFLALLMLPFLNLISCKHENVVSPKVPDVRLETSALLGKYLVDNSGKTLYFFSNDADGASNCTGGCLTNWPVFYVDSTKMLLATGLLAADFKTITTPSGAKQTTFKGWPLYYYAPAGVAEAAGETKGEGVGNVWYVAKPDYSIMIANFQLTGANTLNYLSNYTAGNGRTSYFCDATGNTLYSFARDSALKNKYTRPDFSNNAVWPMYETDNITVPSTLDKTLFEVMTFNGRKQLTYKGWPLYYYGADNNVRGSNKGITVPITQPPGAIWPVVVKAAPLAPR
jgi:predicted lipoprotein with Yx(FWY)xxD motif